MTETDTTVTRNCNIRPRQLLSCLYTTLNFLRTCVYCSLPAHLCLVRVGQVELALLAGSTVYSSLSSPLQMSTHVIVTHSNPGRLLPSLAVSLCSASCTPLSCRTFGRHKLQRCLRYHKTSAGIHCRCTLKMSAYQSTENRNNFTDD